ncbi:unnamed protein product [Anisakis simplex]|uniref:RING finger protein 113 homolog (inferred by orthology to a C. elegans protein) n=1 Tax=Anisakis simplex TaxID=6269 RepID=A0A0M3K041_ANISI|nr:unnamed protein product [Anisakis simplex]
MSDEVNGNEQQSTTVVAFRRRTRGARQSAATRKRQNIHESSDSSNDNDTLVDAASVKVNVVRKPQRKNPMIQSVFTSKRKQCIRERVDSESSDSLSSNPDDAEEAKPGPSEIEGAFKSSGTAEREGPKDLGATAVNEMDTDIQQDAQAQFERVQKALKEGYDDKVYLGTAMYGAKEKKDTARGNAASGWNRVGPMRAPNFIRQSVRWDFAPDICKDYKETGFCTFGDSCKFLHDRTDYKHGWEIERDYAAGRMAEDDPDKYVIHSSDEDDDEDACKLPFKCFICRESFTNPVVTRCKHYFCEKCALKHFRKTPRCFVCDENTKGVFNVAKELIAKMKEIEEKKGQGDGEEDSQPPNSHPTEADSDNGDDKDTKIEMLPAEDDKQNASSDDSND